MQKKVLRLSYHITARILLRKGTRTNLTHILVVLVLRQCISGIADPALSQHKPKNVALPLFPLMPLPTITSWQKRSFLPFGVFWPW